MKNLKEVSKKKKIAVIIAFLSVVVIGLVAVIIGALGNNNDLTTENNSSKLYLSHSPYQVDVGVETQVTFKASLENWQGDVPDKIELYSDENFIGNLYDDGSGSDVYEGDRDYTGTFTVYADDRMYKNFYAKWNDIEDNDSVFCSRILTDEEIERMDFIDSYAKELVEKYDNDNEYVEAITSYLDTCEDLSWDITNLGIFVRFDFAASIGLPYLPSDNETTNTTNNSRTMSLLTKNSVQDSISSKIITLQPSASELTSNAFDKAAEKIADSEYNYIFNTNLDDENVTFETMKTLSNYKIAIIDGHGGNWDVGYILLLSDTVTEEKNAKYIMSNDLGETIIANGSQYVITEEFFDRYYSEGDLANTFIYLGTCHGGDDSVSIRKILESKGNASSALITYKGTVVSTYNHEIIETVSKQLCKGKTIGEALALAKSIHGDTDPHISKDEHENLSKWNKFLDNIGVLEKLNGAEPILTGNKDWTLDGIYYGYFGATVKDEETKNALLNINVTAKGKPGVFKTKTGENGEFELKLPAGEYTICLTSDDGEYIAKEMSVSVNKDAGKSIFIYMTKLKTSTITGNIKDSKTNLPISGVTVEFVDNKNANIEDSKNIKPIATATTDKNGQFTVQLPYDSYSLSFNHSDYEYYGTSLTVKSEAYEIEEKLTPKNSDVDLSSYINTDIIEFASLFNLKKVESEMAPYEYANECLWARSFSDKKNVDQIGIIAECEYSIYDVQCGMTIKDAESLLNVTPIESYNGSYTYKMANNMPFYLNFDKKGVIKYITFGAEDGWSSLLENQSETTMVFTLPKNYEKIIEEALFKYYGSDNNTFISLGDRYETDSHIYYDGTMLNFIEPPSGRSTNILVFDVSLEKKSGLLYQNDIYVTKLW